MKSLWNDAEGKKIGNDLLAMRVYTSRLLGQEEDLVMHGGGNTSVKIKEKNIFGEDEDILYVKGSGWDLGTIQKAGFSPAKLNDLLRLAELKSLSDMDMVKYQRMALTNPSAPNPSVEAILHAIIPYVFVDHTHADAVVTITNTPEGKARIQEIYGSNMLIVPYVMPGFILAKKINEMTKDIDWDQLDGMILLNHGVFTFDNDGKASYEKMISIVSKAENYLNKKKAKALKSEKSKPIDYLNLAAIRREVAILRGSAMLAKLDNSGASVAFSNQKNVKSISDRGPMTPDHIIRTKRSPIYISSSIEKDFANYKKAYTSYFEKYNQGEKILDVAPRWAVVPGIGTLSFGSDMKAVGIIEDISRHTKKAICQAETLSKWKALPQRDLFEMEYWSLEQAKLGKPGTVKPHQGKVAVITGAASGIGKACVEQIVSDGGAVIALDIDKRVTTVFKSTQVLGVICDVTNRKQVMNAIAAGVMQFGGIDYLISNAGFFPKSASIADMADDTWERSMSLNLTSHQQLLTLLIPYLSLGVEPAVVFIGSKNVPAPGPGAAAYSAAKAGLAQLARVAALELGGKGIRINTLHPNAVYDTGLWTEEVLAARAKHYGLTVEEYKTNNILKTEVKSTDVASLASAMLGPLFSKITGSQLPIDGGNDRVI